MATYKGFSLAAILLCAFSTAFGQGTYTQIDEPDAVGFTEALGVDNSGDIVGTYADSSGGTHGFLLSNGTYITIDYPGVQNTELFGINDQGQIVGYTNSIPPISFLYNTASQTFTLVSFPGAPDTYAMGINDSGTIAGYVTYQNVRLPGSPLKVSDSRRS